MEGCLPFITFCNVDKMISMTEIKGHIDVGFTRRGKKVRNEWEQITILHGNPVKPLEIYTEMECSVVFMDK